MQIIIIAVKSQRQNQSYETCNYRYAQIWKTKRM